MGNNRAYGGSGLGIAVGTTILALLLAGTGTALAEPELPYVMQVENILMHRIFPDTST